jgi:hypothetical protein
MSPGPARAAPAPPAQQLTPATAKLSRVVATARPRPAGPARTLARALPESAGGATGASGGGGGGGVGGGHNSDLIYTEMLRRVREEQEQLGQLINHPF